MDYIVQAPSTKYPDGVRPLPEAVMDKTLAMLVPVIVGCLITLLTQWMVQRRESQRSAQARRERRVRATQTLYENVVYTLDRTARTFGEGDERAFTEPIRLLARVRLNCPPAVCEQFLVTAEVLDTWVEQARKGQPKRVGQGLAIISATDKLEAARAQDLFPIYEVRFEELQRVMREHLEDLKRAA